MFKISQELLANADGNENFFKNIMTHDIGFIVMMLKQNAVCINGGFAVRISKKKCMYELGEDQAMLHRFLFERRCPLEMSISRPQSTRTGIRNRKRNKQQKGTRKRIRQQQTGLL